jgi:hypothetical protein
MPTSALTRAYKTGTPKAPSTQAKTKTGSLNARDQDIQDSSGHRQEPRSQRVPADLFKSNAQSPSVERVCRCEALAKRFCLDDLSAADHQPFRVALIAPPSRNAPAEFGRVLSLYPARQLLGHRQRIR